MEIIDLIKESVDNINAEAGRDIVSVGASFLVQGPVTSIQGDMGVLFDVVGRTISKVHELAPTMNMDFHKCVKILTNVQIFSGHHGCATLCWNSLTI